MAMTITDGCMGESEVMSPCNSTMNEKSLSQVRDIVVATREGEGEQIPFHKHCQKTVCSAHGYNGQGATWYILNN
jgi:hypothetical protein